MKKAIFLTLALAVGLGLCANGAWAYTINDPSNDSIGVGFESYGIDINNFTPGVNSGAISFNLYTDYPQAGLTVGAWVTTPADLFIRETYYGVNYLWAIPLVDRPGFTNGTMYAVGTYKISDNFEPAGGGYTYNHNVPVQIATIGNNYGVASFPNGAVSWNALGGNPNWRVDVPTNIWEDDPNGVFLVLWGTSTCANDVVGAIPLPPSVLLLGSGLLGLVGLGWRRRQKTD